MSGPRLVYSCFHFSPVRIPFGLQRCRIGRLVAANPICTSYHILPCQSLPASASPKEKAIRRRKETVYRVSARV
jgi:hypothetical protein